MATGREQENPQRPRLTNMFECGINLVQGIAIGFDRGGYEGAAWSKAIGVESIAPRWEQVGEPN